MATVAGRITFIVSAVLVFTATAFQIAKPFQEKSARGLSLTFICIALLALTFRIPYFVLRAKVHWYYDFPIPVLYYSTMIGLYVALLFTKLYWDKKERDDQVKKHRHL